MTIELTQEQRKAYDRYITLRDKVKLVPTASNRKNPWVRFADVVETVDVPNSNHPLFTQNDEWLEYKQAYVDWLAVEPQWRKDERMSALRGDYGTSDSWEDRESKVRGVDNKFKGV
jgi:hypothetical protein